MSANLQTRMTVKQLAKLMNVSERLYYMVQRVRRLRPDLLPEVEAGRLRVHAALCIAENRPKPTSWDRLVKAWNAATDEDRERLSVHILGSDQPGAAS